MFFYSLQYSVHQLFICNNTNIANIARQQQKQLHLVHWSITPLGFILSIVTLVVIMIFFVTSADSATYVLGMLSAKGSIHPSGIVKISWGVILALFAVIMIYTGGTQSIQKLVNYCCIAVFSGHYLYDMRPYFKAISEEETKEQNHSNTLKQSKGSQQKINENNQQ
ncbi:glycine betaine transporter [Staphylococcus gallinarum]|uniref:Glycine betaine transporter n=1 Tax=Staphylococcus gallinarum TaxID=1293 RepID=A0A380FJG9_STAGA|nr:glycine betaine transporter [Staphylococcus gallinarum]